MGISQEEQEKYFNQEYGKFMSIPDEKTTVLKIPPHEAVAEAIRVISIVEHDRQELLDADVKQELIDSYPARSGAFIYSIVRSQTFSSDTLSRNKEWVQMKKEAVALRRKLVLYFRRAFRNDPKLLEAVARIMAGKGNCDFALSMLSLSKLGNENRPLLEKLKRFKFELLDRSAELSVLLSDLMTSIEVDSDEEVNLTTVVNKAWTYLKEALDEIYEGGRFAFPEGAERHSLYYNDFYKRLGMLGAKQRAAFKIHTKTPVVSTDTLEG